MKIASKIILFLIITISTNFVFAQQSDREIGIDLYQKGEYEKALGPLQNAVKIKDKDQDLWLYIGMAFMKLKKSNKGYDAFNKADQRSIIETAGNDVNIKTISKPRPSYTDNARMNQVQGSVKIAVEVGANGKIEFIALFKGLREGLSEETLKAAKKLELEPAIKAGKPTHAIKIFEYKFSIY